MYEYIIQKRKVIISLTIFSSILESRIIRFSGADIELTTGGANFRALPGALLRECYNPFSPP